MNIRKTQTTAAISLICLAIFVGLSGCHKAPQPPPVVPSGKFDLKGLFLGMNKEEARAAAGKGLFCIRPSKPTPKDSCFIDIVCSFEEMTLAGKVTKSTYLMFKDNQLTAMDVSFPTEYFPEIAAAFTSQYGKPKDIQKETVKNRLGASFEKANLRWKIKDALVWMSSIYGKVDEGSIHVEAAKNSAPMEECILNATKAAKNDL